MRFSILKIDYVLMITFSLSGCIGAEWQTREIIQNPDGLNRIERNSYTTEHEFEENYAKGIKFPSIVVEKSHCGVGQENRDSAHWKDHPYEDMNFLVGFWSMFLGYPHYFQWKQDSTLTVKDWDKENSKRVATIRFTKRNFKLISIPLVGPIGFMVTMPCIYDEMDTDEIISDYYNTLPLSLRYKFFVKNSIGYNHFYDLEQLDQLLWKYPGAVIQEFSKVPDFVLWKRLYEDAKKHGIEATFVYLFWKAMKNSQREFFYRVVPDSPFGNVKYHRIRERWKHY